MRLLGDDAGADNHKQDRRDEDLGRARGRDQPKQRPQQDTAEGHDDDDRGRGLQQRTGKACQEPSRWNAPQEWRRTTKWE